MPGAQWLELLCHHISDRFEHLVRYVGWYSPESAASEREDSMTKSHALVGPIAPRRINRTTCFSPSAMCNTGALALPSTLWAAAFMFWSPSLVEKATEVNSRGPT